MGIYGVPRTEVRVFPVGSGYLPPSYSGNCTNEIPTSNFNTPNAALWLKYPALKVFQNQQYLRYLAAGTVLGPSVEVLTNNLRLHDPP